MKHGILSIYGKPFFLFNYSRPEFISTAGSRYVSSPFGYKPLTWIDTVFLLAVAIKVP